MCKKQKALSFYLAQCTEAALLSQNLPSICEVELFNRDHESLKKFNIAPSTPTVQKLTLFPSSGRLQRSPGKEPERQRWRGSPRTEGPGLLLAAVRSSEAAEERTERAREPETERINKPVA